MTALIVLLIMVFIVFVISRAWRRPAPPQGEEGTGDEEWEYGDAWKEGVREETPPEAFRYVEILRGDTGQGYDDTIMMELVGYLGSVGIRATYDSFSIGLEPAAIKTYVLKVEEGREREAREHLKASGTGVL